MKLDPQDKSALLGVLAFFLISSTITFIALALQAPAYVHIGLIAVHVLACFGIPALIFVACYALMYWTR